MDTPRGKSWGTVPQQAEQYSFLHVQPVLCLVEHHGARRINHRIGNFLTAVRRQAVHEQRTFAGTGKKLLVHLVKDGSIWKVDKVQGRD